MLAIKKTNKICIIAPEKNKYSETFIQAHVARLSEKVVFLHGGFIPRYDNDDKPIDKYHSSSVMRVLRALVRRVLKLPTDYFEKKALMDFLANNNIDAVLAEYGYTGAAVIDVCEKIRIPLIVHFYGCDAYDETIKVRLSEEYKILFKKSQAIIAVSDHMKKRLLNLGATPDKIFVNRCGVDTYFFHRENSLTAQLLFVAVGRFVDKKAPHLTLLAFKKVSERCPEARLIMIGDGPLLEVCKQMAKALRIVSSVEFLMVRTPNEIAEILRKARAFVQHSLRTSYGDSEGIPVAILEASASGVPVVATRHSGIPEAVINGETGFLVEEGDIDAMAERMLLLLRDPNLAERMGRAARERIIKHFSIEKSIDNLRDIIQKSIREYSA